MKLYRSKGSIWTGTQADAKAAQGGNDYESIEVPTDKPSLLTWLNEFDVRPGAAPVREQTPAPEPVEAPPAPDREQPTEIDPTKMRPAQLERFEAVARKLGWTPPGETPPPPPAPEPAPRKITDMSATATLSRMDNPGVDVDGICETIGKAKGWALRRYAGAVAVAFQLLGDSKK